MKNKLKLFINGTIIKKAKNYSQKEERSLSDLIENYLKALTCEEAPYENELAPIVKSLKGSFKLQPNRL